jgi:hypothetical protein
MSQITNPVAAGAASEAMRRGAEAYRKGKPCTPPQAESVLSRDWWEMGWQEARDTDKHGCVYCAGLGSGFADCPCVCGRP